MQNGCCLLFKYNKATPDILDAKPHFYSLTTTDKKHSYICYIVAMYIPCRILHWKENKILKILHLKDRRAQKVINYKYCLVWSTNIRCR